MKYIESWCFIPAACNDWVYAYCTCMQQQAMLCRVLTGLQRLVCLLYMMHDATLRKFVFAIEAVIRQLFQNLVLCTFKVYVKV